MSTPEVFLLLKLLPPIANAPPKWMTADERATLERMVNELLGKVGLAK
jgi:hypothetical protein